MGDKDDFAAVEKSVKRMTTLAFILGVLHVLGAVILSATLSEIVASASRINATTGLTGCEIKNRSLAQCKTNGRRRTFQRQ
jgi:hypothetical protein